MFCSACFSGRIQICREHNSFLQDRWGAKNTARNPRLFAGIRRGPDDQGETGWGEDCSSRVVKNEFKSLRSLRDRWKAEDSTLGLREVTCPFVHLSFHWVGRGGAVSSLSLVAVSPGRASLNLGGFALGTEMPALLRGGDRRGQAVGNWEIPELFWTQKTLLRRQGEKGKWT